MEGFDLGLYLCAQKFIFSKLSSTTIFLMSYFLYSIKNLNWNFVKKKYFWYIGKVKKLWCFICMYLKSINKYLVQNSAWTNVSMSSLNLNLNLTISYFQLNKIWQESVPEVNKLNLWPNIEIYGNSPHLPRESVGQKIKRK